MIYVNIVDRVLQNTRCPGTRDLNFNDKFLGRFDTDSSPRKIPTERPSLVFGICLFRESKVRLNTKSRVGLKMMFRSLIAIVSRGTLETFRAPTS